MRHQNSRKNINQYLKFENMISNFDLSISRRPDIAQKCFCPPDGATDPTFQMRYVSAIQHVCSWRYQSNNLGCIFFGTPCMYKSFMIYNIHVYSFSCCKIFGVVCISDLYTLLDVCVSVYVSGSVTLFFQRAIEVWVK